MFLFLVFINYIPKHSAIIAATTTGGKQIFCYKAIVSSSELLVNQVLYCTKLSYLARLCSHYGQHSLHIYFNKKFPADGSKMSYSKDNNIKQQFSYKWK